MGITDSPSLTRFPIQAISEDFRKADLIIAMDHLEHEPLLQSRFPIWSARTAYWHVKDTPESVGLILGEVECLIAVIHRKW